LAGLLVLAAVVVDRAAALALVLPMVAQEVMVDRMAAAVVLVQARQRDQMLMVVPAVLA
jgi:hypothetical protein